MTRETEALLAEVLLELLRFLKRANEKRDHEQLESQLAEIRAKRFGYPLPRHGRRR